MKRLHKKCLFASFGLHGLLLILMVVAPAFLTKPEEKKDTPKPVTLVSGALVAAVLNPPAPAAPPVSRPDPPKPAPKKPTPKKAVTPTKPKPKPVIKKPEPKKVTPKPRPKPAPKKTTPKKTTPKKKITKPPVKTVKKTYTPPKIKVSIPMKLSSRPDPAKERRERERREQEKRDAARREAQRMAALKSKLASATSFKFSSQVKVRTSGGSSRATMDYGSYVMGIYDRAWREPRDLSSRLTASVTVTISRSGSVISASISRGSGVSRMDSSIRSVLNSIRKFKAFPTGMNESRKTFTIDFSIREK